MFSWIVPDWLKGIYEIISATCRLIYDLLSKVWHIIVLLVSALVAFFQQVVAILTWLVDQFAVVVGMITSSASAANAAQAAGWPPQMFGAVAWLNYYAPVGELMAMLAGLVTAWVVCSIVRIVKSCIPTIS